MEVILGLGWWLDGAIEPCGYMMEECWSSSSGCVGTPPRVTSIDILYIGCSIVCKLFSMSDDVLLCITNTAGVSPLFTA